MIIPKKISNALRRSFNPRNISTMSIGSYNPPTKGHLDTFLKQTEKAENGEIVAISCGHNPKKEYPISSAEDRAQQTKKAFFEYIKEILKNPKNHSQVNVTQAKRINDGDVKTVFISHELVHKTLHELQKKHGQQFYVGRGIRPTDADTKEEADLLKLYRDIIKHPGNYPIGNINLKTLPWDFSYVTLPPSELETISSSDVRELMVDYYLNQDNLASQEAIKTELTKFVTDSTIDAYLEQNTLERLVDIEAQKVSQKLLGQSIVITGPTGTGKSTIVQSLKAKTGLEDNQIAIFDEDKALHKIYQRTDIVEAVAHYYPQAVNYNLNPPSGTIDRTKLAEVIKTYPNAKSIVENITIPALTEAREKFTAENHDKLRIHDWPLYTKFYEDINLDDLGMRPNFVIGLTADYQTRANRLTNRIIKQKNLPETTARELAAFYFKMQAEMPTSYTGNIPENISANIALELMRRRLSSKKNAPYMITSTSQDTPDRSALGIIFNIGRK